MVLTKTDARTQEVSQTPNQQYTSTEPSRGDNRQARRKFRHLRQTGFLAGPNRQKKKEISQAPYRASLARRRSQTRTASNPQPTDCPSVNFQCFAQSADQHPSALAAQVPSGATLVFHAGNQCVTLQSVALHPQKTANFCSRLELLNRMWRRRAGVVRTTLSRSTPEQTASDGLQSLGNANLELG